MHLATAAITMWIGKINGKKKKKERREKKWKRGGEWRKYER
jgi:hypothetical protein